MARNIETRTDMDNKEPWMVVCRWPGGRNNKPPKGEALPYMNIGEADAKRLAAAMTAALPAQCSTTYQAMPMPSYLR